MYSRWFNYAVLFLWLATMTWLVTQKVIPPLLTGQPPSYEKILDAQRAEEPVGWELRWDGRPIGWAVSSTRILPDHSTDIHSRVHFDALPLGKLAPHGLQGFSSLASQAGAVIEADARSILSVDPLGQLSRVELSISFDPFRETIRLEGIINGDSMDLSVHSQDFVHRTTVAIDTKALLGNTFSPQTCLPGLWQGQTWTVEVCRPLPLPAVEVLEAKVERMVRTPWNGGLVPVWLVVYHGRSGLHVIDDNKPRGRLWVRQDGTVLKQELNVFGATMTFVRLDNKAAAQLLQKQNLEPDAKKDGPE
ncbi:MAG: hypothetical protein JW818_15630 [Pirellulales bacterium]|nr:hypothetical protein [Pirellulales bacterium]